MKALNQPRLVNNHLPRMATSQPLTHKHCTCYYKIRTAVRATLATLLLIGVMFVAGWVDKATHDKPLPHYPIGHYGKATK